MLAKLPEVGQFVIALSDEEWDVNERFQTKGDVYEIVGISEVSGNPYFTGDLDEPVYVDEDAFDLYELHDNVNK